MTRTLPLLLAACSLARGAGVRGDLAGLIQDTTGAVLISAGVTAMDEETGVHRTARTDGEGVYEIAGLPAGLYKVTARKPGFQTVVRWHVKVAYGQEARLDFVMQVGSMQQVITIESGPPPINADDGSVGTLVSGKTAGSLPIGGRGVLSLAELAPGVVATPAAGGEAGQFSADGLRANTNYFTVDGVSANTAVTGGGLPAQFAGSALPAMTAFGSTQNLVSMGALDEVRILTSSFAPQFGRLPGAQVALTTRSGSNEFHGSLLDSLRNEKLDANDWVANAQGQDRAPLRLNQWGATLGGPLRPDRTFFFASYDGLRLRQPYTWTTVTPSLEARAGAPPLLQPLLNAFPSPTGPELGDGLAARLARFSRPSRLDAESLRIDHALTGHVTLFGRYNRAPSFTESGFAQIEHLHLGSSNFTLGISAMLTPAVTNDVRANIWSTSAASQWTTDPSAGGSPLDFTALLNAGPATVPAFYGVSIGGTGALFAGAGARNRQGQWNLVETLAVNRPAHAVRLGADYERLTPARESAAQTVTGAWNSLADLLAGHPPVLASSRVEQASSLIETLSLFAQDTWRALPRLTLTYGLRWEATPPPATREPAAAYAAAISAASPAPFAGPASLPYLPVAPAAQALWRTRYTQFAPRIGGAFRLGRASVLRAGWGIFYDLGFSMALDPINGFPFNRWQFSSTRPASLPVNAPAFGPRFAPGLALPYVREWNVAYERAFGLRDIVSVAYVGSAGRRLLRREGILEPNTRLAQFAVATNHGASDYDGLNVQYRRRMARGLQGTVSYSWSHALDNGSWDSGLYLADPRLTPASDRASSSFDVRHNVAAGLSYSWRQWDCSGMLRARSGFPVDVLNTENLLGLGFDDISRPNLVPGVPIWIPAAALGGRRLNPTAFAAPGGIQGNLGRDAVTGAGMAQLDLALERVFPLALGASLQLRLEAYNALNHPNPADPVPYLDSPFFGRPGSMLDLMLGSGSPRSGLTPAFQIGGPRMLQVTLRLRF